MERIYERQKTLDLQIPERVLVIGVGGIGSWVSVNLSLIGTRELTIVDDDIIEEHNLNRTLCRLTDIGDAKVEAIEELIYERREDTIVRSLYGKLEDFIDLKKEEFDYIIDCRDRFGGLELKELKELKASKGKVKLGYDGRNITLHFNPQTIPWGVGQGGYEVVPSYLVPPQLLANLITEVITSGKWPNEEKIITLSTEEILKRLGIID